MRSFYLFPLFLLLMVVEIAQAQELKVGDPAPLFTLKNQDGTDFSLSSRRGAGWTVLFFYPKAGTPGCTKQACAFRDSIEKIIELNASVYGISADSVEDQKQFHIAQGLKFDLLADPEMKAIQLFDAKMPLIGISKRWTFILDPELIIRSVEKDVDPTTDASRVITVLQQLQSAKP